MGMYHALAELTKGLAKQFPTKKEVLYLKDFDPCVEPHVMSLAREGYKVTAVSESELQSPEKVVENLGRETLCFVLSIDDPILGLKSNSQELLSQLREKKIFTILVSHNQHFYEAAPQEVERTEAHLHAMKAGLTLGFLGARYKFGAMMADGLPWPEINIEFLKSKYSQSLQVTAVETIEEACPRGAESVFSEHARIKDRALLFWRDLDGHAVIELLAEKAGQKLEGPRLGGALDTLSLSRWGGVNTMKWAEKAFGLNALQVRGSVMIHQSWLAEQTDGASSIEEVVSEIYSMQGTA